jgi:hypothetical protein
MAPEAPQKRRYDVMRRPGSVTVGQATQEGGEQNNVWIAPYYEDDLGERPKLLVWRRFCSAANWPRGEGLGDPLSFIGEMTSFDGRDPTGDA